MKFKVTINTHDGMMARVYTGKYRSLGDAAFGGMRKDEYSEAGHQRRGTVSRATITVEAMICGSVHPLRAGVFCSKEHGHRGYHYEQNGSKPFRWMPDGTIINR